MLTPFPDRAQPILDLIRKEIPRPDELPSSFCPGASYQWWYYSEERKYANRNILSFFKDAKSSTVLNVFDLKRFDKFRTDPSKKQFLAKVDDSIYRFQLWWISQRENTTAEELIDFIWPKGGMNEHTGSAISSQKTG